MAIATSFSRHGLKKIAKENQSAVIVVTHDVRMIEGFYAVYHLKDGRLNNGQCDAGAGIQAL